MDEGWNDMKHRAFFRWLMGLEVCFILLAILVVWLDEILDLPHLFLGAPKTKVNIAESCFETVLLIVIGLLLLCITRLLLKRIHFLEGILPICAFCKKIRVDDNWEQLETVMVPGTDADFSHTVCPSCAKEHYGDVIGRRKEKGNT